VDNSGAECHLIAAGGGMATRAWNTERATFFYLALACVAIAAAYPEGRA